MQAQACVSTSNIFEKILKKSLQLLIYDMSIVYLHLRVSIAGIKYNDQSNVRKEEFTSPPQPHHSSASREARVGAQGGNPKQGLKPLAALVLVTRSACFHMSPACSPAQEHP